MREAVNGEDTLLKAMGYCEEDFTSPRLPRPAHPHPPQLAKQPWSPLKPARAVSPAMLVPNNGHGAWEELPPRLSTNAFIASATLSPLAPLTSGLRPMASQASAAATRAWELAEQLGVQDGPGEDVRFLQLSLQNARECEAATASARTEAENFAWRAKAEVAELRAEMVCCWRREEALTAELRAEKAGAAATAERLAAEVQALREKARVQARRDEVSLNSSMLECRQLQYELQAATSRTQLEVAEVRRAAWEELSRERAEAAKLEQERSELLERVACLQEAALERDIQDSSRPTVAHSPGHTVSSTPRPPSPVPAPSQHTATAPSEAPSGDAAEPRAPPEPRSPPKEPANEPAPSPRPEEAAGAHGVREKNLGRPPLAPNSPSRASRTGSRDDRSASPLSTRRPDGDSAAGKHSSAREESMGRRSDDGQEGKGNEMLGRDIFRRAEALCAQQRHEEAIPLFEEVLQALREHGQEVLDRRALVVAQADVWAHIGVSMQSLDRMHEALASYGRAVALNPLLHACFANLATLHLYLHNTETARRHIGKALAVKPGEAAYLEIQKEVDAQGSQTL